MHVPLNRDALRDVMPAFFDLLREEPHPSVRVVLGHFIFVYIHPYMDGNGPRRALPDEHDDGVGWIPVDGHTRQRPQRLCECFGEGQCRRGYSALADFIAGLVKRRLAGEPLPAVPKASPVDER